MQLDHIENYNYFNNYFKTFTFSTQKCRFIIFNFLNTITFERKEKAMNNRTKKQNVLICNAFKKLEKYLEAEGHHELAIIISHLMYLWLKDYYSE